MKRTLFSILALLLAVAQGTWAADEKPGSYFTVNADGAKVAFSQGNLQATFNDSKWTWAFATNQWDLIGDAPGNTSINGNGTVNMTRGRFCDHFSFLHNFCITP